MRKIRTITLKMVLQRQNVLIRHSKANLTVPALRYILRTKYHLAHESLHFVLIGSEKEIVKRDVAEAAFALAQICLKDPTPLITYLVQAGV